MSQLFQQKQRELLLALARVEELSQQLEALRSSRLEAAPLSCRHSTSTAELERLYQELQVSPPTGGRRTQADANGPHV